MKANLRKLDDLERSKGWSECKTAHILGIDYSYYYRVKRGQRGIGPKFLQSLLDFCDKEELNFRDFIYTGNSTKAR